MPLPVAHGLLGASLVAAVLPRGAVRRYYLPLAAGALLANAADLDFGLVFALHSRAWHRGFTHSFAFALLVCLFFLLRLGGRRAAEAAAYGLAYASHAVLDFATTKLGGGVELLWPFDAGRFALGWRGLSEIPSRLPPAEILKSLCVEFALFAPPLVVLLLLRRRAARAGAAEG
ncbi:MAG TPA: metal-dependent hydrolase [Pyrinomonadaceae bacterium]|jgi:inner membrane protein